MTKTHGSSEQHGSRNQGYGVATNGATAGESRAAAAALMWVVHGPAHDGEREGEKQGSDQGCGGHRLVRVLGQQAIPFHVLPHKDMLQQR
jgi:hypothetical protein